MIKKIKLSIGLKLILLFAAAFLLGAGTGMVKEALSSKILAGGGTGSSGKLAEAAGNWGLSFREDGKPPVADVSAKELEKWNAWYIKDTEDKVLYLTFDAGYENGNTPAILDALKKHNAPACFFIVGHYLKSSPDLVRRMVDEGHLVGNHSFNHPDMSSLGRDKFAQELTDLESLYLETFGKEMPKLYRPPLGKFSEGSLKLAKELGYQTFFWSLAYVDWDVDKQPSREDALDKLTRRVHPGAVVLLHVTSKTNGEIMDEILTKWEEMGYSFKSLTEFAN